MANQKVKSADQWLQENKVKFSNGTPINQILKSYGIYLRLHYYTLLKSEKK
tara:strand:+ start:5225 stop:5377 length:153 start_codon:yes stop_codon:yes gene_type:complete